MNQKNQILLFVGLVAVALVSRWVPHPANFSPLLAIALFAGVKLENKALAFGLPLLAIFISDVFLGFYPMILGVYACLALVVGLGVLFKSFAGKDLKSKALSLVGSSFLGSLVFYLTSNALVWAFSEMYSKNTEGLFTSYAMGLPFFNNTLVSTLFYSAVLWAAYDFVNVKILKSKRV